MQGSLGEDDPVYIVRLCSSLMITSFSKPYDNATSFLIIRLTIGAGRGRGGAGAARKIRPACQPESFSQQTFIHHNSGKISKKSQKQTLVPSSLALAENLSHRGAIRLPPRTHESLVISDLLFLFSACR